MTKGDSNTTVTCFDALMESPVFHSMTYGRSVFYSSRAINKSTSNEDALAIVTVSDNCVVLIIADGMGGLPAGEEASRTVVQHLIESVSRVNRDGLSVRETILDGIEEANDELLIQKKGSGTTLVVAEVQDNWLRTYHAGDSPIMLVGNRGKIKYSAIPHSPTGYALEAGMIDKAEAMMHEERHLISNYIGSPDMRVEIGPSVRIAPRDTLILASDGLSDNLYDNEIIEICRKGNIMSCSRKLMTECLKFMQHPVADRHCHPDDLSFILFRLH